MYSNNRIQQLLPNYTMSTFIILFNELMDKIVGFVITQLLSTLNNGSFLLTN